MLQNGQTIRDFKIIKKVGEGGMGEVYLAHDENLMRKVAVKVLAPELTRSPEIIERFKQEARLQASLIHPNIVTLFTFFKELDTFIMIQEFAEGITLKELIAKEGKLPEDVAIAILRQALEGLGYAHQQGVVHRDIKPSNIIVDNSMNVKIMDFGIAKALGDRGITKTGAKMGTVYYMSPEQVHALKDIDQRTDIYSLGITLYEMLTGTLPYNTTTESDYALMNQIVTQEIGDPRAVAPNLSGSIVNVMTGMIFKERDKRYKTCYQVGVDLTSFNRVDVEAQKLVFPDSRFDANSTALASSSAFQTKKNQEISLLKYKLQTKKLTSESFNSDTPKEFHYFPKQRKLCGRTKGGTFSFVSINNLNFDYNLNQGNDGITAYDFNPEANLGVIGDNKNKITIFDIATGEKTKTFPNYAYNKNIWFWRGLKMFGILIIATILNNLRFGLEMKPILSVALFLALCGVWVFFFIYAQKRAVFQIAISSNLIAVPKNYKEAILFSHLGVRMGKIKIKNLLCKIQFTDSGSHLFLTSSRNIAIYDNFAIEALTHKFYTDISLSKVSPSEKYIAIGLTNGVVLINELLKEITISTIETNHKRTNSITFNPGETVVSVAFPDGLINFYEVVTGKSLGSIEAHSKAVTFIQFISDNELISIGEDGMIKKWQVEF